MNNNVQPIKLHWEYWKADILSDNLMLLSLDFVFLSFIDVVCMIVCFLRVLRSTDLVK